MSHSKKQVSNNSRISSSLSTNISMKKDVDALIENKKKILENFNATVCLLINTTKTETENSNEEDFLTNRFSHTSKSKITVIDYMEHIYHFLECENNTIVLTMMLIDKFMTYNDTFVLTNNNSFKLIIVATTIAYKFIEDTIFKNREISLIGGMGLAELNYLESLFLESINYDLHNDKEEFDTYNKVLLK